MTKLLVPLFATALLTGCAMAPDPELSAQQQNEIARELAGRTAQPVQRCLNRVFRDSVRDVGGTVMFGNGKTIYKMETRGSCSGLDRYGAALVTRNQASSSLCAGDFVRIMDTTNGIPYSQCTVEGFTPYRRD